MGQLPDAPGHRTVRRWSHEHVHRPARVLPDPHRSGRVLRVRVRPGVLRPVGADPLRAPRASPPGQRVLDVACGTGIVARTAADLVAPDGTVVGVDLNEAMLTVARRVRPDIEFHQGNADALPFADETFDTAAVTDGADVLPRPAERAPGDGPGRRSRRDGRRPGPRGARRPARLRRRSSTWPPATPAAKPCPC